MNNWWKDPRLDDEGTYDYLVEELPRDHAEWSWRQDKGRCETCGKERHLIFSGTHYFYCWDGWDSMSYDECWRCVLQNKLYSIKHRIIKRIKVLKTTAELRLKAKMNLKKSYEFAKMLEK